MVSLGGGCGSMEAEALIGNKFGAQELWSSTEETLCTKASLNNRLLCSIGTQPNLLLSVALQASCGEDVISRIP